MENRGADAAVGENALDRDAGRHMRIEVERELLADRDELGAGENVAQRADVHGGVAMATRRAAATANAAAGTAAARVGASAAR